MLGGDFNRLIIWALETGNRTGPIKARRLEAAEGLPAGLSTPALRPDGALLAIGDRTGTITLLDTTHLGDPGRNNPSGEDAQSVLAALAFSPDGRHLAVYSPQGQILIWSVADLANPQVAFRLPGHAGGSLIPYSTCVAIAWPAAPGIEPMIEIWNLDLIDRELARLGFSG